MSKLFFALYLVLLIVFSLKPQVPSSPDSRPLVLGSSVILVLFWIMKGNKGIC